MKLLVKQRLEQYQPDSNRGDLRLMKLLVKQRLGRFHSRWSALVSENRRAAAALTAPSETPMHLG
jgi:hypothetical protein